MDALTRQEYPAMLERLRPGAAVTKLNERVKKIGKVNSEIADWLSERRKVEEAYAAGLKKLVRRPLQEVGGDLGVFEAPWKKIVSATEDIANSHLTLADQMQKDVEQPLRTFATNNREMSGMATIQGNLGSMAKEQEDAHEKADKLSKKGGKANAQKVESANSRLQTANQQWDSQAPFIFETLQALDETRLNHLRDKLTQYQTLEADQIERNRDITEKTLDSLVNIDTAQEIQAWSQVAVAGKPMTERRVRQQSTAGSSTGPPPATPRSDTGSERISEQSGRLEPVGDSKLRSRFGTMLGRRRQSMHGGFARSPSPNKHFPPIPGFGRRDTASSHGRPSPSPRASSNNMRELSSGDNRLSSLAESPTSPTANGNTNGVPALISDALPSTFNAPNGVAGSDLLDVSDVPPPPGPPPSHLQSHDRKDSEGYTVPAAMNDPISQAQQEAAQEGDAPQFNVAIRSDPIPEQDADAQAALSNVANTLRSSSQAITPNRKVGTVRGRRDVRNTIYMPSANSLEAITSENPLPPSPGVQMGRNAALAALSSSEHPGPSGSDTTSIRSGHSLTSNIQAKHTEMHKPGLNASFIETVSATFVAGQISTSKINGEIALHYNKSEFDSLATETIRINSFPNLEAIGPNRTFIHQVPGGKEDEFTIDLSTISSKSAIAFTYRVHVDDSNMASHAPLLLKQAWKPIGDKLALVVEYSLNPAYSTATELFHNLIILAHYTGARATACQTKPTGTHVKERSLVYWRLGDVSLTNEWHKVICRFVGAEGAVPEPGHIDAKWELHGPTLPLASGISLSKLEVGKGKEKEESDDPFADDSITGPTIVTPSGNWVDVETSKKIVGGKYEARQVEA